MIRWNPIISVLSLLAILFLMYFYSNKFDPFCNETVEQYRAQIWNGYIIDKYIDSSNHRAKTILIRTNEDTTIVLLSADKSKLFHSCELGDHIIKSEGSLLVKLQNQYETWKDYQLNFGCPPNLP